MADKNGNGIDDALEADPTIQAILAGLSSGGTTTAGKIVIPDWLAKIAGIYTSPDRQTNYPGGQSVPGTMYASPDQLANLPYQLMAKNPAGYSQLAKYLTGNKNASIDAVLGALGTATSLAQAAGISLAGVMGNSDFRAMVYGSTGTGGGSGGPTSQYNIRITSRYNAAADLTSAMNNLLGRKPTKQEIDQYVKELNDKEKKLYTTTTYSANGVVTTGAEFDRAKFLNNFVLKKADFGNEDMAGDLGAVQDNIERLINDNGLGSIIDGQTRIKYLRQLAKGLKSEDAINNELRNLAKISYGAWSDLMDKNPDMTLREIASPYISVYSSLFEVDPNTLDLTEVLGKTQGANGLMSLNDFKLSLRKDPKFEYTTTAKQEAMALGASFARSMGVNI